MSRKAVKKRLILKRLAALVLSTALFLSCGFYGRMGAGMAALAAETAWSETEPRFDIYLSQYLKKNMGYTLKQNLMQHVVCEKMEEHVGLIGQAIYELEAWASSNDYRIEGKKGLYEALLYDILKKQIESEAFQLQAQSNADIVLKAVGEGLKELGNELLDAGDKLHSVVSDGETAVDTVLAGGELIEALGADQLTTVLKNNRTADVLFEKLSGEFAQNTKSSALSLLLKTAENGIDFVDDLIQYYAFTEFRDSQITFLQHVYRYTDDADLQEALLSVIHFMQGVNNDDICDHVARSSGKAILKTGIDFADTALSLFIPVLALPGIAGIFSDLVWRADDISMAALTLQAHVELEKAFIDGLRIHLNHTDGTIERARAVNCGYGMLWTAYDHGIDLALGYFDLVLGVSENLQGEENPAGSDSTLTQSAHSAMAEMNFQEQRNEIQSYGESFHKIVDNYFGVVDEVYASYRREHADQYGKWKEIRMYTPVKGLLLQQTLLRIPYEKRNELYMVGASVDPADADQAGIRYTSSNESVVTVSEAGILTVLAEGIAQITAVTEEGGFQAVLTVVAEPDNTQMALAGDQAQSLGMSVAEKYPDAFEHNEDGYTLKQVIPDWVNQYVFAIPETVNGVPITEIDFSRAYYVQEDWEAWEREGKTIDFSSEPYQQEAQPKRTHSFSFDVILPLCTKRVADDCFRMWTGGIRLNEGLEAIGERAFCGWEPAAADAQLIIPSTVTEIGENAFACCGWRLEDPSLAPEHAADGQSSAVWTQKTRAEEVPLSICFMENENPGQGLEILPSGCFQYANLKAVILPETLKEISERAFAGCRTEEALVLPSSLETIGASAFSYETYVTTSGGDYWVDNSRLPDLVLDLRKYPLRGISVEIPMNVRRIGARAFYRLAADELILPDTVQIIGEEAFACSDVRNVACTPASGNQAGTGGIIKRNAFADCTNLEILELPANTVVLDEGILTNCPALSQLIWPDTLYVLEGSLLPRISPWFFPDSVLVCTKSGLPVSEERLRELSDEESLQKMESLFSQDEVMHCEKAAGSEGIACLTIPKALVSYVLKNPGRMPGWGERLILQKKLTEADWREYVEAYAAAANDTAGFQEIYCLNDAGEETLIYRAPERRDKISAYFYENAMDFRTTLSGETEPLTSVQIGEMTGDGYGGYGGCTVEINGNDAALRTLQNEEIRIFGWQEDHTLSEADRAAQLGMFAFFEDAYLRQDRHLYLQLETASDIKTGDNGELFQLILTMFRDHDESELHKDRYALYHINELGLTERVPIEVIFSESEENPRRRTTVKAEIKELGSYALIYVDHTKEEFTVDEYLEELHELWNHASKDLSNGSYTAMLTEGTVKIEAYEQASSAPTSTDDPADSLDEAASKPALHITMVPEEEALYLQETLPKAPAKEEVLLKLETGGGSRETSEEISEKTPVQAGETQAVVTVNLDIASEEPVYPVLYIRQDDGYERRTVGQVLLQDNEGNETLPDIYTRPYELTLDAGKEYIVGFTDTAEQTQMETVVRSSPVSVSHSLSEEQEQNAPEKEQDMEEILFYGKIIAVLFLLTVLVTLFTRKKK